MELKVDVYMPWTNYHCHTQYCDGRAVAEDFVKAALERNFSKLGFSSHSPVPFKSVWNMDIGDLQRYISELNSLKTKYHDKITIYLGMEVDYIPGLFDACNPIIRNEEFDFLIGSVHYMDYLPDGETWAIDGANDWFDTGIQTIFGGDVKKYAQRFTQLSCEMMEKGGFDIVGHIDKMFQHGSRFFNVDEPWYRELVGKLLTTARDNDLIVEINTKSFRKMGFFYPHQSFFKLLSTLNVKVTINSDTHVPENIELAFNEATEALLEAGIKEVYEFNGKEWQPFSLTKKGGS